MNNRMTNWAIVGSEGSGRWEIAAYLTQPIQHRSWARSMTGIPEYQKGILGRKYPIALHIFPQNEAPEPDEVIYGLIHKMFISNPGDKKEGAIVCINLDAEITQELRIAKKWIGYLKKDNATIFIQLVATSIRRSVSREH